MQNVVFGTLRRAALRPAQTLLLILALASSSVGITVAVTLVGGRVKALRSPAVFQIVAGRTNPQGDVTFAIALYRGDKLERLRAAAPNLLGVTTYESFSNTLVSVGERRYRVFGGARVGVGFERVQPLKIESGNFFRVDETDASTPPVVLSQTVARALFGASDRAVGKTVNLMQGYFGAAESTDTARPHRVIGVYSDPPANDSNTDGAYLYTLAQSQDRASALIARSRSGSERDARDQLLQAIRSAYRDDPEFMGQRQPLALARANGQTGNPSGPTDQLLTLFIGFAAIMASLAAISVLTAGLVDVRERTRDIGVQRALGATRGAVVAEFILGSTIIAFIGAIVGLWVALAILPAIADATGPVLFRNGLEFSPVAAAVVVAVVIGFSALASLYPAWQAAKLKPVEALREA